ncbi:hypothetical protein BX596_5024 [Enterobacteriaceae bacterium JKS000233]|nr:hypothetical protein BX596_5024 [Enterobacteriaceae bacterium JKS000233]
MVVSLFIRGRNQCQAYQTSYVPLRLLPWRPVVEPDCANRQSRYPESTLASHRGLSIYRHQGADAYMTYHNGIYRTGHNEGKLTAEDIETVATTSGAAAVSDDDNVTSDHLIENNDALAEMLGLTGTPGIIIMPVENATADNTTVLPGVVSEQVMQQAIARAAGG